MPPIDEREGRQYWRSLDELAVEPEFRTMVEREFQGKSWETLPPTTRRQFLKVMGASIALAGFAGCRWPVEKIVPFARPAGYTPGSPLQFATSMELNGVAQGLVVTSYDGRPIKIEGNPNHPQNRGATDMIAQASVLELYDPGRSRSVVRRRDGRRSVSSWDEFESFARGHFGGLLQTAGKGLWVLSEGTSSPTFIDQSLRFQHWFPQTRWIEYEPILRDRERRASSFAFQGPYRTHLALENAKVIVCLDADILMTHPDALRHARDFAAGRRADREGMNRLYAIEAVYSVTGGAADHRFAIPPSRIPAAAAQLAAELFRGGLGEGGSLVPAEIASAAACAPTPPFVATVAGDLLRNRGKSVIVAGPRQPAHVHALVHLLNERLGNFGATVFHTVEQNEQWEPQLATLHDLVEEMQAGRVYTLLILGGNPVYNAPADMAFADALAKVPHTIHLSLYENETSRACAWHLPRAHYLESWGDARAYDGTIGIVQPLIAPLYGGRTPIEILSLCVDEVPKKGHEIVRQYFERYEKEPESDAVWKKALNDGFLAGSAFPIASPRPVRAGEVFNQLPRESAAPPEGQGIELVFHQDSKVYDGRFANNSWLQEIPDPLTKLTWDNAALVSPATAASLGVKADDVVTLRYRGRSLDIPVYVMPGLAPGTVAVPLGYGRTAAGSVGDKVGANAYLLRTSDAPDGGAGVTVTPTGRKHKLACTQEHHAIDLVGLREVHKRVGELVRSADLETYRKHPSFANEAAGEHAASLWKEPDLTAGHQWGMSIDLGACIGCGACAVACQAENNVPVVGREQVLRRREMHWLRIDRYFTGDPDAAEVVHQPVACVQCENAPCEQVCPVNATVHSQEGLNQMVYNRCVGTRYCSNNCPYKVRRFNWFNNHRNLTEIEKMVHNPEVTVRSRGVMEKCTYCVQRIEAVKIAAKNDGREIRDGEIVPACAQACPTKAIVFGDLSDHESRVRALHQDPRSYGLLAEINTQPRTLYMAKITNPEPGLAPNTGGEGEARG